MNNALPLFDGCARTLKWNTENKIGAPLRHQQELQPQELHLWLIRLNISPKQQVQTVNWLNPIQADKHKRRATQASRDHYLAGRYYLFKLLSNYSGIAPEAISLQYSRLNKPFLSNVINGEANHELQFNFTDTVYQGECYGLFGFARSARVGVDIEALSRSANFSAIAQRRFSQAELEYCYDHEQNIINERFLALWTRKEAFGKATAKGINYIMNERNLFAPQSTEFQFHENGENWYLHQIELTPQLISSVVHAGSSALDIKGFTVT